MENILSLRCLKPSEIRLAKTTLGFKDDLKLPINTMEVLRRRYLLKDGDRNVVQTPSELFRRVASHTAQGERNFKSSVTPEEAEKRFYHMMQSLQFMPNSPTLMNSGTSLGQLPACFIIFAEDSGGERYEVCWYSPPYRKNRIQ
jgi:ribonucleoside-diphosphate reductase alpha chain